MWAVGNVLRNAGIAFYTAKFTNDLDWQCAARPCNRHLSPRHFSPLRMHWGPCRCVYTTPRTGVWASVIRLFPPRTGSLGSAGSA
eukprot:2900074-Prymnesium_polylepis.2